MYSQFDGNAAFSGGGFMPSQATQSTDYAPSSSKNRDCQGLFPLTVKQITEAYASSDEKSNFVVDGVDVNNITMVGILVNKVERVTDVAFSLDDGTGRIDCHRWMNEGIDSREMEEIQDGMYVRIHGHLKGFQGKRHLSAFSVRPLTNFNEIAFHFLECMYVHVYNTKLQNNQGSAHIQPHLTNSAMGMDGPMGYQAPVSNQFSVPYSSDGTRGIDLKVLDYLHQPAVIVREKGVHVEELAQQLKVPLAKMMESIRSLEVEGSVYSTIDEYHYKSAVNG